MKQYKQGGKSWAKSLCYRLRCKRRILSGLMRSFSLRCMETFCTSPNPKYKQAAEEPPALKNGRVTPITGSRLRHIPKLKTVCAAIMPKNPKQIKVPNRSQDTKAVRKTRNSNNRSKPKIATHPIKPSSSPATAKIKSLS